MKRGLTLLLASLLAFSLTACGGGSKNDQNGGAVMDSGSSEDYERANGETGGSDSAIGNSSDNGGGSVIGDNSAGRNGDGSDSAGKSHSDNRTSSGGNVRDDLGNMMQDAGDAMDNMVDDLTGDTAARGTPQRSNGPAWNGNLQKPNYPGSAF